ncbi:unnamed protein product [Diatraea saccharalis]|uniref:RRM domain-containing protein n=1 Tax=Diatraea saccharalis TaxID=40085 RepID=A0A9P0G356_9NEOP|nr:unnamed protein product [Diatraea saccharalis]
MLVYIFLLRELSELDRWRSAFDRLQQVAVLQPEHWLRRLQTEVTLAHSEEARTHIAELFQQATLDCYSIPILSEWCTWSISSGDTDAARTHIDEVLRRAGADPLSGKIFWDAKLELEKAQLETMSEENPEYKAQQERVLFCLEETVSRPLLRSDEAWQPLEELAASLHDQKYVDKVKKQHEAALDYLQKITSFEDKLLTIDLCLIVLNCRNQEDKYKLYQEYIDTVKELSQDEKYGECDSDGILKVLYDRATTECSSCSGVYSLLHSFAQHVHRCSSRTTYCRVLDACTRRCPRRYTFWTMKMQQAEHEKKSFDEVKAIFEKAISKGMETYKDAEMLWLSYLEYVRRQTSFDNDDDVQKLRQTFRLAWDSLAEAWGEEANDCEVPLYWARLEYRRMNDPKQGKEIFEEIFKYGENKTLCKYWEAFIHMECDRKPPMSENKRRDLYRRALRFVADYPPAVTRLWTDYERDYGSLDTARECYDACEVKLKEWKETYQAMKDKMIGKKQKGKQTDKKGKFDKKKKKKDDEQPKNKNKRKSDENVEGTETKRKRDNDMEVEESGEKEFVEEQSGSGRKRTHDEDNNEDAETKRQKTESSSGRSVGTRDACTLFVSNLDFKVDEQKLRDILSKFGDIVSLRVKSGNKAFGGSICYCQYKTPACVEEALKHDRTPLEGRPMFFSRYSAKKVKATFKYSTEAEKNKLFIKNLPYSHCAKEPLTDIFDKYGKLKDVRIVTFKDGNPKGLAYVEYEDDDAASKAIAATNGLLIGDRHIEVAVSQPPPKSGATPTLGLPKREQGQGMRRTQLSSFIPSVLQKPVASTSTANGHNDAEKRPLSNTDFRNLLLKK